MARLHSACRSSRLSYSAQECSGARSAQYHRQQEILLSHTREITDENRNVRRKLNRFTDFAREFWGWEDMDLASPPDNLSTVLQEYGDAVYICFELFVEDELLQLTERWHYQPRFVFLGPGLPGFFRLSCSGGRTEYRRCLGVFSKFEAGIYKKTRRTIGHPVCKFCARWIGKTRDFRLLGSMRQ